MDITGLINSTGNVAADQAIQHLVRQFETNFPNRIRGYFVEGSHADKTALSTSDIDLIILFKDAFINELEHEKAKQMATTYDLACQLELDIAFLDEKAISGAVPPSLKLGSSLLFGKPVDADLPMISLEEWGCERMHAAYWLMTHVFGRPAIVTFPHDFPKPEAQFYGYTERVVRLADGRNVFSTRDLVRVMGWAGTALVALIGKQIVARKRDSHILYRQFVNDEWTSLFDALYEKCRLKWAYLIPDERDERDELRAICQRALAFENHFLNNYKQFLLSELRQGDHPSKMNALLALEGIPFVDQDIINIVRDISTAGNEELSQQAAMVAWPQDDESVSTPKRSPK